MTGKGYCARVGRLWSWKNEDIRAKQLLSKAIKGLIKKNLRTAKGARYFRKCLSVQRYGFFLKNAII
jgi:hypothetical protein